MRSVFYSVALSLLILTTSGCGKSSGSVSGKVTYQGKALPGGHVNFLSEGANATVKSSEIQPDGSYAVSGLPVGPVKISVQAATQPTIALVKGQKGAAPKSDQPTVTLPPKYSSADQSGLKYDVKPGAQPHDIELK